MLAQMLTCHSRDAAILANGHKILLQNPTETLPDGIVLGAEKIDFHRSIG